MIAHELSHPPARTLKRFVDPLNRFFDWLYHSEYNPLYRSGTLAVGLLVILLISGLYLVFFYSVGLPYESIQTIQGQPLLGRWIRAVHRYASDLALIAVAFHIIQLLVQSKTWGPRVLAWLSGVVLLGALFLSVYSGYVMVWDDHAKLVAVAGSKLLSVFPFLKNPLAQAFSGTIPIPDSFFFVNLFLHIALPLIMIFGLWVHTARLSRSVWFPTRSILKWTIISLIIIAVVWPAPLPKRANLLEVTGRVNVDLFYFSILSFADAPILVWSIIIATALLLCTFPWWWRPSPRREASVVDDDACTGCTQCAEDCPYEAITMHPRPDGKRLLAKVEPALCVSCGICSVACGDLAIGPPQRSGKDELDRIQNFIGTNKPNPKGIAVLSCLRVDSLTEKVMAAAQPDTPHLVYDCCGTCHTQSLEKLLSSYGGVLLLGCPERNCMNRDGFELMRQRMFEKRVPFLDRNIDRKRIMTVARSVVEAEEAISELKAFESKIAGVTDENSRKPQNHGRIFKRVISSAVLLCGIAKLSGYPLGFDPNYSLLRISGSLPAQVKTDCREATQEELAKVPMHMRQRTICETKANSFLLKVRVDDSISLERTFSPTGIRADIPIFVNEDIEVSSGTHRFHIELKPQPEDNVLPTFLLDESQDFIQGKIKLINVTAKNK